MSTTLIENYKGALAHASTTSHRLNLFFQTVRAVNADTLTELVAKSWEEHPLHTLKILFYCRDCRGGKGERQIFFTGMKYVIKNHRDAFLKNMELVVTKYGRWSDLLEFIDIEEVADPIAELYAKQLKQDLIAMNEGKPVTLCAKWAPTEHCAVDNKKHAVKKICAALGVDKKTYRKEYLVPLRAYSKVIETYMCAKEWSKIDYSKVPGVAMKKLRKAFAKNDKERFEEYLQKLKGGDKSVKVNAATVEPHEIVQQCRKISEPDTILEEQWKEIVKRVEAFGTMSHSIVLSDVSGSMEGTPMLVSVALGLLISELTLPPFKDLVITFHENPSLFQVTGDSLMRRVQNLLRAPWGGTTNLQAAFDLILNRAVEASLTQDDMPSRLYIISDMQFDVADRNYATNHEVIKNKYKQAGYEMPQIVYWNVSPNTNGFPVTSNEQGVALLAGFSSSLLKSVINGKEFTPFAIMLETIDEKRYEDISL